jgi:hypothetical protein
MVQLYSRRKSTRYPIDRSPGGSQMRSRRCGRVKNLFPLSKMELGILSNCVYFRKLDFSIDNTVLNFLLHASAFRPSSGVYILCWLHCSSLTLGSVYSGYIVCCRFDILGCNATIYVFVRTLNLKNVCNCSSVQTVADFLYRLTYPGFEP